MTAGEITIIIALGGLFGTVIGVAVRATWQLGAVRNEEAAKRAELRDDMQDKLDETTKQYGETVLALREKINLVELTASQVYMRRDGFYKVQDEIKTDMKDLWSRIEQRFEKFEEKLDRVTHP